MYDYTKKPTSSLRMTYCSALCECGPKGIGFDLMAFINGKYSRDAIPKSQQKQDVYTISPDGSVSLADIDEEPENGEPVLV